MTAPKIPETNKKTTGDTIKTFIKNHVPSDETTTSYMVPITSFAVSCATFGVLGVVLKIAYRLQPDYTMFNYSFLALAGGCAIQLQNALTEKDNKKLFYWVVLKIVELILMGGVIFYLLVFNAHTNLILMSLTLMGLTGGHLNYLHKYVKAQKEPVSTLEDTVYDIPTSDQLKLNVLLFDTSKSTPSF